MTNFTQEYLTNLLTTDREKLTRICAETCYGFELYKALSGIEYWTFDQPTEFIPRDDFQPLANTEKGRSQAFELADRFGLELDFNDKSVGFKTPDWRMENGYFWDAIYAKDGMQAATVIASILTAQALRK